MTPAAMTLSPDLESAPTAATGDERALVRRAAGGDGRAFEQLYRRHAGRLYGLCWRLCDGDERRAEAAAQDAFVRAWEKLDSFRGESQFGTWLHRLTVNVVLGEKRLLKRWTTLEQEDDAPPPAELRVHDPDATLATDLERALARLPKGARTVLLLHDVEGYRHDEIAALTGIAVGTSKAQLHRARKLMKERLQ
jgi:RNA polymerase sigma factor (sigma-70 family)